MEILTLSKKSHYYFFAALLTSVFALMQFFSGSALAQATATRVSLDAAGWTVFAPSATTHVVYVSSSTGKDGNTGSSPDAPVKTIAKGLSFLRSGFPDWLLLKKGDIWTNELFGALPIRGRSATEPMLFSSYGTGARPLIKTNVGTYGLGSFRNNSNGDDIALVGIEFYSYTRDPNSSDFAGPGTEAHGLYLLNPITWFLMEDCKFSFYDSLVIQQPNGRLDENVIIRRNIITDNYSTTAHAQGLYVDNVSKLVLEENLFDHNGWNASVPGAAATIFNHNIYIQTTSGPASVKGNIFANASSHGAQVRPGGTVINNLFVANPIGLLIASSASAVNDNVFSEGNDILTAQEVLARGYGIDVNPSSGPIRVSGNVISHDTSSKPNGHGISLGAGTTGVSAINNVIYKWNGPIDDHGTGNVTSPNSINRTGYPDPNRTVESYNAFLGGNPTLAAFLTEARKQTKDSWRPQYTASAVNNYIRFGFGMSSKPFPASTPVPPG